MPSPISIIHNGVVLLDQLTTVNKLNDFFANLGQELASKISIRDEYDPIKDYMPPSNSLSMYVNPCMVEEIISLMMTMKKSKSTAIDGFDITVIDGIFDVIAKPLSNVFNSSFASCEVPVELKKAKVIPIYKANDKQYVGNYRPIFILPIFLNCWKDSCLLDCHHLLKNVVY